MDLSEECERRYLPVLEAQAEKIRISHPSFFVSVGAHRSGVNMSPRRRLIGASCGRRPEFDSAEQPNLVELFIEFHDIPDKPVLSDLGVCWGGDGTPPPVESLWMLNEAIPLNLESMKIIDDSLPTLFQHLERCLVAWETSYPIET